MNILITGGASGLGEAITQKMASDTANNVYFTYHKSNKKAKTIEQTFANSNGIKCDFTKSEDIEKLSQKLSELNIEVLVNNAMTGFTKNHFHKLTINTFEDSFRENIIPTIRLTQEAIKCFRKAKFGKIITILSAAIINTPPVGWSEYVANKAYLHALSKAWASENATFNISSNCISPGFMPTMLNADTDERVLENIIQNHPLKKLLQTSEVADVVYFLCHATQHINGSNIVVNAAENII